MDPDMCVIVPEMSDRAERITVWLREKVSASGTRGLIFGLSGGIDSAVVARLCQLALPQRVVGLIMPCYSHPQDEEDARLVAEAFAIPCVTLDLNATFDALTEALHGAIRGLRPEVSVTDIKQQVPEANLKPRLRMTTLYFVANSLNYLVAGTGNRSEIALGYFTKYGDGGVDVLPIGSLLKSEVGQLARDIGVPGRIIDKPPSAGLWVGQTDEAEMGFTYEQLEGYLTRGPSAVPAAIASRIERLRAVSEHKRALPPIGPS
jgi:NAD+ synthase